MSLRTEKAIGGRGLVEADSASGLLFCGREDGIARRACGCVRGWDWGGGWLEDWCLWAQAWLAAVVAGVRDKTVLEPTFVASSAEAFGPPLAHLVGGARGWARRGSGGG